MQTILVVLHLFLSLGLIGLVLMQHGRGADAGAAFGSGASGTVFGASGAANFLSRTTAAVATLFFVTSLALGYFSMQAIEKPGLMESAVAPAPLAPPASEVPAIPGAETGSVVPAVPVEEGAESAVSAVPATPSAASTEAPASEGGGEVPEVPDEEGASPEAPKTEQ